MARFVLVHGAWHGGWCWRDVADTLRSRGHGVSAPTLTGLGERAHLLSRAITLDTHITDVLAHLAAEDLSDVVLVGHSYAGAVVLGVADRARERIARLVLLDAVFPDDGETCMDALDGATRAARLRLAAESSAGLSLPVPPAAAFGVEDARGTAWLEAHLTPHPLRTYLTPLRLSAPRGNGLPCAYIACTDPAYAPLVPARARAAAAGWPIHDLATGHDAMVSAPQATADLLERLAA